MFSIFSLHSYFKVRIRSFLSGASVVSKVKDKWQTGRNYLWVIEQRANCPEEFWSTLPDLVFSHIVPDTVFQATAVRNESFTSPWAKISSLFCKAKCIPFKGLSFILCIYSLKFLAIKYRFSYNHYYNGGNLGFFNVLVWQTKILETLCRSL